MHTLVDIIKLLIPYTVNSFSLYKTTTVINEIALKENESYENVVKVCNYK